MKFRKASLIDLSKLNEISLSSKRYWGYPEKWIEHWADDLTITEKHLHDQKIIVLELESLVIGYCSIADQGNHYEVMHLWVIPEYIGNGYGKALLMEALHNYIVVNKPILVTADPNSEAFYQKQGFVTFQKVESFPPGRFLPLMKMKSYFHH